MTYALRFSNPRRVLLVVFSETVTDAGFKAAYNDVESFMRAQGPCSAIVDFSAVERFELSNEFARELGKMRPAIPVGVYRVVVSPQPEVYGTARIVTAWREGSGGELILTKSSAEAFEKLAVDASNFEPV